MIPLKTFNLHYIRFLPHTDGCEKVLCRTGKETFLTDRSQPNNNRLSSAGVQSWRSSHLIRK